MKHQAADPFTDNRLGSLIIILLLAMFFCPLMASSIQAAAPQISPPVQWSTFVGGTGSDSVNDIAVDENGDIFVTGFSSSTWGAPLNEYQANDIFVAKYDKNGSLLWNTFLGGSGSDIPNTIVLDGNGNIYISGYSSLTWGTPINPFDDDRLFTPGWDVFVAKLDSTGQLQWNTFLGGDDDDHAGAMVLDGSGNIYITGESPSTWGGPVNDFAGGTTDAFVAKLNTDGALQWHTFLGGSSTANPLQDDSGFGLAVDPSENIYITGISSATWGSPVRDFSGGTFDAFIAKLNSSGVLQWNTFLGGSASGLYGEGDLGSGITLDKSGNVYVTGGSLGSWGTPLENFPYGAQEAAFVARLSGDGVLLWHTFFGGWFETRGGRILLDDNRNIYVSGSTQTSWDDPFYETWNREVFLAGLNNDGTLLWHTFLGGEAEDYGGMTIQGNELYAGGVSYATWGSPKEPFEGTEDGFIAKLGISKSWSSSAPMAHGRTGHSATLLPDGRVLVVGGSEGVEVDEVTFHELPLASAEIYNPADNTWTGAGSMATARIGHTAILLPDGRVLVAGGAVWPDNIYSSGELYDPVTNTWSSAGVMSTPRYSHTATLLPDGMVLVAGGYDDITAPEVTNSVDLYNPATNTWSSTGSMTAARTEHTASLLSNGKVMVAGGYNNSTGRLSSAEVYDPGSDTWSAVDDMTYGSAWGHSATVLPDGKVLIVGGQGNEITALARTELFDPDTGSWTVAAPLNANRLDHTATLLPDGTLLVTGGYDGGSELNSTELYDPASNTWSELGVLSAARGGHTATLLPAGQVFIAGGAGASFPTTALSSTEIFHSAKDSWSATAEMLNGRGDHTATLLPDGRVLVSGGLSETGILDAAEMYDPVAKTWASTGNMAGSRAAHTSTLLPDGRVLVAGGFGETDGTAELFDSTADTWSGAADLTTGRGLHTASLLPDGKVLIVGGRDAENSLASAELYDPAANTWSGAAAITAARDGHAAALLPDGRVFIAGGLNRGSDTTLSSAELYDPSTNSWIDAGQMNVARHQFSAILLPEGRVFVAGGFTNFCCSASNSAELYDPLTNTWAAAANMAEARGGAAMTLLPDGRVLVAGGQNGPSVLSSAEVYDPATNTWSNAGNLLTARVFSEATLLADGQLLITGGLNNITGNILVSAELYDVGLDYDDAWRPTVTAVPEPLYLYLPFSFTGTGFRGLGNTEGSSGGTSSSATNVPLVQLRSNLNGQVQWLHPEEFSAVSYTGKPIYNFPPGPAWLTVFVNGIPSVAKYVLVEEPYTATVNVGENGRIDASTPSPAGVVPGSNATVQFTFTADAHHHIAAITGCGIDYTNTDNGIASLTVTTAPITGNCTVSADFAINRYAVSGVAGTNGRLDDGTPSPQMIDYGATTQFTFTADAGYHIASISGCGINYLNSDQAVTIRTETTEGITGDCTVNGTFAVNTYLLHVEVTGRGTGSVASGPTGIDCPGDCAREFEYGTVVTLTALPDGRSTFLRWTGDCIGIDPSCTLTMDGVKNVTAGFYSFPWPMFLPAITVPVKP